MSIFGITKQQARLKKRAEDLARQRRKIYIEPVRGVRSATKEVNHYCNLLNTLTKKRSNLIKSFIPGTQQFAIRKKCSESLNALSKLLNQVEHNLKYGRPYMPVFQTNDRSLKKSLSDTEAYNLEKYYKSPISQPYERTTLDTPAGILITFNSLKVL